MIDKIGGLSSLPEERCYLDLVRKFCVSLEVMNTEAMAVLKIRKLLE